MLELSAKPWEVPVKIDGEDYILRQPNGDASIQYRASMVKGAVYEEVGGKVNFDSSRVYNGEPYLVSLCLFKKAGSLDNANGSLYEPVSEETIRAWPDHVYLALYAEIQERSPNLLGKHDPETVKKQIAALQKRLEKTPEAERKN